MPIDLVDEVLWLPEQLAQGEIADDIARHYPKETGGMLLGYTNGSHGVVTAVIAAGPNTQRGAYHMLPDDRFQQERLLEHFQRTEGRESFLGEWHSHPEAAPTMSKTDRRTLYRVTVKGRHLAALPVMVIFGVYAQERRWEVKAYRKRNASRLMCISSGDFVAISIRTFSAQTNCDQS